MHRSSTIILAGYGAGLVLAPLLLLGAWLTDITPQAADTAELLTLIADDSGAWQTGQLFFFLSGLAWIPAGLGLMRLFADRSRLGVVGGALTLVGGAAILPVDAGGVYLTGLAGSGVALSDQVAIVEATESSPFVLTFELAHIVGLFVGLLIVTVALFRTKLLPVWAPIALLLSLVGVIATTNQAVQIGAIGLMALTFGAAGYLLWQTSRDSGHDRRGTLLV